MNEDEARQVRKVLDVLYVADQHFTHEARMNAALHMSEQVRPAPLASAIGTAVMDLERLLEGWQRPTQETSG